MESEDILADSLVLFGESSVDPAEIGVLRYGKMMLMVAPKEGKANTLLASSVFSPSLFLADEIGSRRVDLSGRTVLELGSGAALPLLLAATLEPPPALITLSDYPDETIIGSLQRNLNVNRAYIQSDCQVNAVGYAWGADVEPLLSILRKHRGHADGYDVLILSDLLHFDSSHSDILSTVVKTLSRSPQALVYVAAGLYTREPVREAFLKAGEAVGFEWTPIENSGQWQGRTEVRSDGVPWSLADLQARKSNVVAWRDAQSKLECEVSVGVFAYRALATTQFISHSNQQRILQDMPPKKSSENLKQKTLFNFIKKPADTAPSSSPKTPFSKHRKPTNPVGSSPDVDSSRRGDSSDVDATMSSPAARVLKNSSSVQNSSPNTNTTVDLSVHEDSDDEAPVRMVGKPAAKRKVRVHDSDSESEGNEASAQGSFAQRIAKHAASKDKAPAKKRRTSMSSRDEDDFVVSDEEVDVPSSKASDDEEFSGVEEESPKKKGKKAGFNAPSRPPAKPTASAASGGSSTNFMLTAAEQRAQNIKADKKVNEETYAFLKDPKDKDGVRHAEEGHDPRTLLIPKSAWSTFTPFEKQFWEIKQNHFDTILFFQKGKFFELYENDAQIGHSEFDLKLTDRVKMKMVGVPESSFQFWAAKFLAKGYKVGRVDQAETQLGAEMRQAANKSSKGKSAASAADKIVRRELSKVLTNGTLVDPELLQDEQAGHCVSIRETEEEGEFGLCVLDASTGEFNLSAFKDDVVRTRLETIMRQIRPKELVYSKGNLSVATTRLLKVLLPSSCLWTSLSQSEGLPYDATIEELKTLYPPSTKTEDGMEEDVAWDSGVPEAIRTFIDNQTAIESLGSMVWYLRQLNIDKDILTQKNFNVYDPLQRGKGLALDGQTLSHIEVLVNSEGTEEGTLLKLLGRCITPFGKRLFRIWLCNPLQDVKAINDRLDAVQDLMKHPEIESSFTKLLAGTPDLERIVSRVHAKSCHVKDFLKVLTAFESLSKGLATLADMSGEFENKSVSSLLRQAPDLKKNIKRVRGFFNVEDELLVPSSEDVDEAYSEIQTEIKGLEAKLEKKLSGLKSDVGCKDLSYWHSATGTKDIYIVQVPVGKKVTVPKDWSKHGGTKAITRYNVPALASTIRSLKEARETRTGIVRDFKLRVFAEFDEDRDVWLRAVKVTAETDCLLSLAKASEALGTPSCRPEFVEDSGRAFVEFENLRHPALELNMKREFIANSVRLGGKYPGVALITGPNMGGKSTVMRMTAAGVIMAQLGMFVPCESARLSPVDAILTRMGAYDSVFTNSSTFKVELDECCKILRDATPRSLVIMDELGRGTSTFDGMAIASSVLRELASNTLPLTLFATHYSSLTEMGEKHPNIRNMTMQTVVDDEKRQLVMMYKFIEGIAPGSFGTHVANVAGVPASVVDRAEQVSRDFAEVSRKKQLEKRAAVSRIPLDLQADFAQLAKLAGGLKLNDDPVQQLESLRILKGSVRSLLASV